jgi:hypothetical protein
MSGIHTSTEHCNDNPPWIEPEFTPYPVAHSDLLAAAFDGEDPEFTAVAILADQRSCLFPKDLLTILSEAAFCGLVPSDDEWKRMASAARYLLREVPHA